MPGRLSLPVVPVPAEVRDRLAALGAPEDAAGNPILGALANQPDLLAGYVELVWRVRTRSTTPRALRELAIVRIAELMDSGYQLRRHRALAAAAGVAGDRLDGLHRWRQAGWCSAPERAVLQLAEDAVAGVLEDGTQAALAVHFTPAERTELYLTVALHCMVARLNLLLEVPADLGADEQTTE